MVKIGNVSLQDSIERGRSLQACGKSSEYLEEFAAKTVDFFYRNFRDASGSEELSLVRFFHTCNYEPLDQPLKDYVDDKYEKLDQEQRYITLLAHLSPGEKKPGAIGINL